MVSLDLTGKVVAVTGGFGSLGASVGRAALAAGAEVALIDRADASRAPSNLAAALALGGVDLGSSESAGVAMRRTVEQFGRLDALVNVAGGFSWEKVEDGSIETWDAMYQINLRTAAALKATAANLGEEVASECLHIFGGIGYLEAETPIGRWWRDMKLARVGGGTDEVLWELVAAAMKPDTERYQQFVPSPPNRTP